MIEMERRNEILKSLYHVLEETFNKVNQKRQYGSERDYANGNWVSNLYLVYLNDYIRYETFFECEVEPLIWDLVGDDKEVYDYCNNVVLKIIGTVGSLGRLNPDATHHELGEVIIKAIHKYV